MYFITDEIFSEGALNITWAKLSEFFDKTFCATLVTC